MKVLLTGASGAVGHGLLRYAPPQMRFAAIGRDFERIHPDLRGRVEFFFKGDLVRDGAGLSERDRASLRDFKPQKIFHAAGCVKFDQKDADEIRVTNFEGTIRMIDLARDLGAPEFHFISTAYAPLGRNPYEASKLAAEQALRASGFACSIYRLGIVVGDSREQRIDGFNGYYGFLKLFDALARSLVGHVRFGNKDGGVRLPVHVPCSEDSTLNLVPMDWLCRTFYGLQEEAVENEMFHLTHPAPRLAIEVMRHSLETLRVRGVRHETQILKTDASDPELRRIQKILDAGLRRFAPYLREEPSFDISNVRKKLGDRFQPPPEMGDALLTKLLAFASSKNFGRRSIPPTFSTPPDPHSLSR